MFVDEVKLKWAWRLSIVIVFLLFAASLFLLDIKLTVESEVPVRSQASEFKVVLDQGIFGLAEDEVDLALLDTAPLYLPTKWNYSGLKVSKILNASNSFGASFGPKLLIGIANFFEARNLYENIELADFETVTDFEGVKLFAAFGQEDAGAAEVLDEAFYQIVDLRSAIKMGVRGTVLQNERLRGRIWHPFSLLVQVTDMGVGRVLVSESSDLEEVQEYFREYFERESDVYNLGVGYYRIDVWM